MSETMHTEEQAEPKKTEVNSAFFFELPVGVSIKNESASHLDQMHLCKLTLTYLFDETCPEPQC